eukprot:1067621-Rhodomonas_salina.2
MDESETATTATTMMMMMMMMLWSDGRYPAGPDPRRGCDHDGERAARAAVSFSISVFIWYHQTLRQYRASPSARLGRQQVHHTLRQYRA